MLDPRSYDERPANSTPARRETKTTAPSPLDVREDEKFHRQSLAGSLAAQVHEPLAVLNDGGPDDGGDEFDPAFGTAKPAARVVEIGAGQ